MLLAILALAGTARGQICNFCSEQELKELLNEEKTTLSTVLEKNGDKTISDSNKFYVKKWHFRYGQCYVYEVTTFARPYSKAIEKVLRDNFRQTSENTWEDSENRVESIVNEHSMTYRFMSKFSPYTNYGNN